MKQIVFSKQFLAASLALLLLLVSACSAPVQESQTDEVTTKENTQSEEAITSEDTIGQESEPDSSTESSSEKEEESMTQVKEDSGFRLIGYMPNWYDRSVLDTVRLEAYTHINYAFAIPKEDGTMRPLPNDAFTNKLIEKAHAAGVKVLLSVGGWSYQEIPLEATFVKATETAEKCELLAQSIVAQAVQYGFDGVDLDWEHPNEQTAAQYEALVKALRVQCDEHGLYLTCAVIGGPSMDLAITDEAAAQFDWINAMGYDGGEGEEHSPLSLAVDYITYWTQTRGIAKDKVVIGVPFYERPSWASYDALVAADPQNAYSDTANYMGGTVYYNGIPTMKEKTSYAVENAGGIMIWQIVQDTKDPELSLLSAIIETLREAGVYNK